MQARPDALAGRDLLRIADWAPDELRTVLELGDRNVVSWGAMLADAQSYVGLAWWTALFPGLALSMLVLAANLVGDGIADAWNVRSR